MIIIKKTLFALAIEVGKLSESTAVALIELSPKGWDPKTGQTRLQDEFTVRGLIRIPPTASYTETSDEIGKLLARVDESKAQIWLVIDQTAVGSPLVDLILRRLDRSAVRVLIKPTKSCDPEYGDGVHHIPKAYLISLLSRVLDEELTEIAKGCEGTAELVEELKNYQHQKTSSTSTNPDIWREQPGDDLILAVALAIWRLTLGSGFEYEFLDLGSDGTCHDTSLGWT